MKYEKDEFLPVVLGAGDRTLLRKLLKKYGGPLLLLDSAFPLFVRLMPGIKRIKMTAKSDDIALMYLFHAVSDQTRIPILATDGKYSALIENNSEKLSSRFIIYREETDVKNDEAL